MKSFRYVTIIFLLLFFLSGCNSKNSDNKNTDYETIDKKSSTNEDLYAIGLNLISTMNEMIQSEEYADIMGVELSEEFLQKVDTNDYDFVTFSKAKRLTLSIANLFCSSNA